MTAAHYSLSPDIIFNRPSRSRRLWLTCKLRVIYFWIHWWINCHLLFIISPFIMNLWCKLDCLSIQKYCLILIWIMTLNFFIQVTINSRPCCQILSLIKNTWSEVETEISCWTLQPPENYHNSIPDCIDEDFLRQLASCLSNEWKNLADELGLSKTRIQAIQRNHGQESSTEDIILDMLLTWVRKMPSSCSKVCINQNQRLYSFEMLWVEFWNFFKEMRIATL